MQETADQYIQRILGHVEGQDALKVQRSTASRLRKSIRGLSRSEMKWKPEPGKWSICEILAHLADAEIVASWRMRLVIGENGVTIQPFNQDVWASVFGYHTRDGSRSLEVFRVLRDQNLAMLEELPPEKWEHYGMHLERGKESIAHLTRMFAGHDTNHALQVEGIVKQLRERRSKQRKSTKQRKPKKTQSKKSQPKKRRR
jgi:hypothetical protein